MSQALTDAYTDVRDIDFLGMAVRAHDTGDGQVCEFRAQAGPIAPPHRHAWQETHFVVEGELEYMVGDRVHRVGPGGFLTIPGSTVHAVSALSPAVRWIEFTTPVGPADFFEEVSREPGIDPTQLESMVKLGEMAARHNVELLLG